jgi:DNA adenine methylase
LSKPILKWAGGKSRLVPDIEAAFGERCEGTYFEPFLGSAAVFLARRAAGRVGGAVLADANAKLVALHVALRDQVADVLAELRRLPRDDWRERYYEVRDAYNAGPHDGPHHAARFVWLNRAGFNGLYRENKDGNFNVPVGKYPKLALPPPEAFLEVSRLFEGVEIRVSDFRSILALAGPRDQVYCDPPYVPLNDTANFTAYYKDDFGFDDQKALADAARGAAGRGAAVVLSNHDHPVVRDDLYREDQGFQHVGRPMVSRAISRDGASRAAVAEVIAAITPASIRAA